jgi:DNA-directed RNA polymerase specialized sigma24 family protein
MQSMSFPASIGENDSVLIAQWRTGVRAAHERLLGRQVEPLRRYLSRRVPCSADVDDLVQRTMLALLDALPRFREDVASLSSRCTEQR